VMLYEVTNNLNTSLTIEDINVTLQARGGSDSSKIITQNLIESEDLRRLKNLRWITITPRPSPIPVWPLSGLSPAPVPSAPVASNPAPAPAPPSIVASSRPEVPDQISSVMSAVSEILELLKKGVSHSPSVPSSTQTFSSSSQDPIFIPSKIIPDAEMKITVASSESDSSSFEDSSEALRRMRKKK
jgi:hypothetical protein